MLAPLFQHFCYSHKPTRGRCGQCFCFFLKSVGGIFVAVRDHNEKHFFQKGDIDMRRISAIGSAPLHFFTAISSRCGRWLLLCVLAGGCASAPSHVKLYEGEALPANELATVRIGEGVKNLESGGEKLIRGGVGELLPGRHEITIVGWWWDRSNKVTNVIRGTLATTCFVGVYGSLVLFPLAATCLGLVPDKTCDCQTIIDVSAGEAYEVSIDWSGISPMLCVTETNGNTTVVPVECVIRE
jgi:hypothetical protein